MDNLGTQQVVGTVQGIQQEPVTQQVSPQYGQTVQQSNAQAVFTQEQVNNIIAGRVNALNRKITELSGQLSQQQQLASSYLNELTGFKQRESAVSAGVKKEFIDFAIFEANKLAVNGKSFDDAIKEYIASNKQYCDIPEVANQGAVNNSPVNQAPTQDMANPAQIGNGQPVANTQAQPTQQGTVNVGSPSNQIGATVPVGINGNTGYPMATSMQNTNSEAALVAEYVSRNLKRR